MPTYAPGDASAALDIPSSSLRRYVSLFGDYLSESARRRRGRRFTDQDLGVLTRIRDLATEGVKLADIPAQLGDVKEISPPETALDLPGFQNRLAEMFEMFQDTQKDVNELRSTVDRLSAELDAERNKSLWDRIRGK